MAKGKGWPKIGTVRKSKEGGNYIKLEDNVEIMVNGEKITLNDKRIVQLQDPRSKVEALQKGGHIDEAEADRRLEKLSTMDWLRYELVVPPQRS